MSLVSVSESKCCDDASCVCVCVCAVMPRSITHTHTHTHVVCTADKRREMNDTDGRTDRQTGTETAAERETEREGGIKGVAWSGHEMRAVLYQDK